MKKILFFIIICLSSLNFNWSEASAAEANAGNREWCDQSTSHPAALISADEQRQAGLARVQLQRLRGVNARYVVEAREGRAEYERLKQEITHLRGLNAGQAQRIHTCESDLFDQGNKLTDKQTVLDDNVVKHGLIIKRYEGFIIGSGIDFVVVSCLENRLPSAHEQIFNSRDFAAVLSTVTGTVVKEVRYRYKSGEKTDGKELLIGGAVDVGCKFVGMKAVTAALFATNYASNFWNEKDCIDVEKHRGTIETVQTVAGNALIFCAGPSLTDFFKH